jgi:hypothetical protein
MIIPQKQILTMPKGKLESYKNNITEVKIGLTIDKYLEFVGFKNLHNN